MSAISNNFGLSSSLEEEVMIIKKQGIVSILGYSDSENTKSALKRTLSADMSSQKWLSQNDLKRIASSEEFPVSSSIDEEQDEHPGQKEKEQFDIWSLIVSNKYESKSDNNNIPPPYIHPLVKRSASTLSEKRLQICTESLGSETGSDGFSSYPASETGDEKQGEVVVVEEVEEEGKEPGKFEIAEDSAFPKEKYSKKTTPRSFPPPLPSLSRGDGGSLHMRPHRDNGRLVLEAVSVPSQNNFRAERQDGSLVLTFVNNEEDEEMKGVEEKNDDVDLFRAKMDDFDNDDEDGIESESPPPKSVGGVRNVHRLALMMEKSAVLTNRNLNWYHKFNNEEGKVEDGVLDQITPLTPSFPPRPLVGPMVSMTSAIAGAAAQGRGGVRSLNVYEYYWKAKPMVPIALALTSPLAQNPTISKNNIIANGKQDLAVLRGSKGCKELRRSLLFWEPYCFATS